MEIVYQKEGQYLLRITKDEELLSTLENFANEQSITGAVFWGLGAVKNSHLTLYEPETKKYAEGHEFPESHELAGLTGNISQKEDGSLFVHAHGVLGDKNLQAYAGHFTRATVAATCEIWLTVIPEGLQRSHDEDTNLDLLSG